MFFGETLSLFVALSWTATALFAEVASKRIGSLPLNITRMVMSLLLLAVTLWLTMGTPFPRFADAAAWRWLLLSGVVGYVIGDFCLMQGYILIGSRIGQLFMTLSAPTAAIFGRILIGEQMKPLAIVGMVVTLSGIALSILSKDSGDKKTHPKVKLNLPLRGIAYAAMAGICQGCGLVLSKVGLLHYESSLAACGFSPSSVLDDALLPLPLSISIPFAATMIRAIMGLAGFMLMQMLLSKDSIGEHARHRRVDDADNRQDCRGQLDQSSGQQPRDIRYVQSGCLHLEGYPVQRSRGGLVGKVFITLRSGIR